MNFGPVSFSFDFKFLPRLITPVLVELIRNVLIVWACVLLPFPGGVGWLLFGHSHGGKVGQGVPDGDVTHSVGGGVGFKQ